MISLSIFIILGKTCLIFNVMQFLMEYIRAKSCNTGGEFIAVQLQKSASLRSFTPFYIHHLDTKVQAVLGLGDLMQSPHLGCVLNSGRVSLCSRSSDEGINSQGKTSAKNHHKCHQPALPRPVCPSSAVVPATPILFLQVSKEKSPLVCLSQYMRICFQNRFHLEQRERLNTQTKKQKYVPCDFMKQRFFVFNLRAMKLQIVGTRVVISLFQIHGSHC